jgi:hypothetical protein
VGAKVPLLLPLVRAVANDHRFVELLQQHPLCEATDAGIWNDIQLLLLRVGPTLAEEWRQRCLNHAEQVGARANDAKATVLSLQRDERIFPGLTGTIEAQGLRSETAAPLDPHVFEPADPDQHFLAGVISALLWFIEHDTQLLHCLSSVFRFGLSALLGDQRERYRAELLRRWDRVRGASDLRHAPQGWKERLKGFLDLDEAVHSLLHQPPADSRSWWGQLRSEVRGALLHRRDLASQEGCPVHLQVLGGSFAEINRLAPDSLQVDVGLPGEVTACLRVWARIDGEELKGRVLYRPPREEA